MRLYEYIRVCTDIIEKPKTPNRKPHAVCVYILTSTTPLHYNINLVFFCGRGGRGKEGGAKATCGDPHLQLWCRAALRPSTALLLNNIKGDFPKFGVPCGGFYDMDDTILYIGVLFWETTKLVFKPLIHPYSLNP